MNPLYSLPFTALLVIGGYLFATRKSRRRKRLLKQAFPQSWQKILQKDVAFYNALSEPQRQRFERNVQLFLAEKRITGIQTEIDERTKLLVAASAIIPVFGFPNWEYHNLGEILIFPGSLTDPYEAERGEKIQGQILGQVAPFQGQHLMRLSKPSLERGFKDMQDKQNVGIHEFAHILDGADGSVDGIPHAYLPKELIEPWTHLMYEKIEDIINRKSEINPYGATNEAEFFAVATEYFFERPKQMEKNHPRLYELLSEAFQQDPSDNFPHSWEELWHPYGRRLGRNSPCPCDSGKKYKKCCLKKAS